MYNHEYIYIYIHIQIYQCIIVYTVRIHNYAVRVGEVWFPPISTNWWIKLRPMICQTYPNFLKTTISLTRNTMRLGEIQVSFSIGSLFCSTFDFSVKSSSGSNVWKSESLIRHVDQGGANSKDSVHWMVWPTFFVLKIALPETKML